MKMPAARLQTADIDTTAPARTYADDQPNRQIIFHIPLTIKRRSGRKQIITPDGTDIFRETVPSKSSNYTREPISIAIARAHRWLELIERGDFPNVQSLARTIRLDRSYCHRLIRLTLLKPELIEKILDNNGPDGKTIEKMNEIPEIWEEQNRTEHLKIHLSKGTNK